jgi:hypothetical protein
MKKKTHNKDTPVSARKRILFSQIRLIHVAISKLGISDDQYREILWQNYKKRTCKDLSYKQAQHLIYDHFAKLGFKPARRRGQADRKASKPKTKRHKGVTYLVSKPQWSEIYRLLPLLNWTPESLRSFCTKKFGLPYPRTMKEASKLISSMYGILNQDRAG